MLAIIGFILVVLFALWAAKTTYGLVVVGCLFGSCEALVLAAFFAVCSGAATWVAIAYAPFKVTFGA